MFMQSGHVHDRYDVRASVIMSSVRRSTRLGGSGGTASSVSGVCFTET